MNIKSVVEEVIERTGLMVEANKKIGQLSKGYRQRVGIAAAIISGLIMSLVFKARDKS